MAKLNIRGIIPAFISPFDSEMKLNCKAAAAHAEDMEKRGAAALYVGGSSGEMILMSSDERKQLLEAVKDAVNIPIIAHIGCANCSDAYELARHADSLGVAAISSVTPFYYKYSFGETKHYYQKIADTVKTPMIIYNIPVLSGSSFTMDQLFELLSIDGVGGMKFTSSDFFTFERLRRAFPDKLLFNGGDEVALSGLSMGADGAIGTTYNVLIDIFVNLYKAFCSNDMAKALECQHKANDCISVILAHNLLPAVKCLVTARGIDCGECREPMEHLSDEKKKSLCDKVLPLLK